MCVLVLLAAIFIFSFPVSALAENTDDGPVFGLSFNMAQNNWIQPFDFSKRKRERERQEAEEEAKEKARSPVFLPFNRQTQQVKQNNSAAANSVRQVDDYLKRQYEERMQRLKRDRVKITDGLSDSTKKILEGEGNLEEFGFSAEQVSLVKKIYTAEKNNQNISDIITKSELDRILSQTVPVSQQQGQAAGR